MWKQEIEGEIMCLHKLYHHIFYIPLRSKNTLIMQIKYTLQLEKIFIIMLLIVALQITLADMDCTSESEPPKYYLIEKCHRSKLGTVAYANFSSLTSCKRLGVEKKGLALNFSPLEARGDGMNQYSCEVLRCAEVEGGWSLVNDTRFDYYSLYAKPLPSENSTCVPATGMFYLLPDPKNYTDALLECNNMTGVLADIIAEHRTETLAQVLIEADADTAFVGMRRFNKSSFSSDKGIQKFAN